VPPFTQPASRVELYSVVIVIGILLTITHESISRLAAAHKQIIKRVDEISLEKLTPVPVFVDGEFERYLKEIKQKARVSQ
jgi:hypothetical protein